MPKNSRESTAAIFASMVIVALTGCNSGASRDVYQQKMAREIRVLEDQLYEADYHNRVLSDQVERYRAKQAAGHLDLKSGHATESRNEATRTPKSSSNQTMPDPIEQNRSAPGSIDMDAGFGSEDLELELPSVDTGEPVPADALDDSGLPVEPIPLLDPESDGLPAPGLPQPPGKEDTMIPPVEPGQVVPPPAEGVDDEVDRPGRIELPDTINGQLGSPQKLRIHAGLSTGIESIDGEHQMTIVVHATDKQGNTVNLDNFDIDAELSVVLLDPERQASDSRIGRWDFARQRVPTMIRRTPISGIEVPLTWTGDSPLGDKVLVHVRLRGEEDDMRCERKLVVNKKRAIAEWTPRGDDARR